MFKTIDKLHFCDLMSPEFDKKVSSTGRTCRMLLVNIILKLIDDQNHLNTNEQLYVHFWWIPDEAQESLINCIVAHFRKTEDNLIWFGPMTSRGKIT